MRKIRKRDWGCTVLTLTNFTVGKPSLIIILKKKGFGNILHTKLSLWQNIINTILKNKQH